MEQYAIAIIIQDTDTLQKVKLFFGKIKDFIQTQPIPDVEIRFFIGVARNVAKEIKDLLGANDDGIGDLYLPNMQIMEFGGQDYPYDEMKQRLFQWIGEQWMGNYQILDLKSDLKDLITNFKKY